jgi:hypothetical protein
VDHSSSASARELEHRPLDVDSPHVHKVKAARRGRRRPGLRTVDAPRSALELVLDSLDTEDWGRTLRLVVGMLGAAMAVLLVLGGLIGLAVALGRTFPGFAFGVGAGAGCAGSHLAARLRRQAASADDDRPRAAAG